MDPMTYFGAALLVAVIAFGVFRIAVRRDYRRSGRLTPRYALLQYLPIAAWVCFGWLNIPPGWPKVSVGPAFETAGWALFVGGWLAALAGMFRLGMRRSHGLEAGRLRQSGMYRLSRNPQTVAFLAAMLGYFALWPTWRNAGVLLLAALFAHLMTLTEEEHLRRVFGEEYRRYCERVPRYVGPKRALPRA